MDEVSQEDTPIIYEDQRDVMEVIEAKRGLTFAASLLFLHPLRCFQCSISSTREIR